MKTGGQPLIIDKTKAFVSAGENEQATSQNIYYDKIKF